MSGLPSILPTNHKEFNTKEYWDRFFTERKAAFEWYGNLRDLKPNINSKIPYKSSKILMIGCGNSDFSANLYDEGYINIVNLDFSEIVIEEMKKKNVSRPEMTWVVGDMTNLEGFETGSFDIVLDKGALDALMSENTKENKASAIKMYKEIDRVLSSTGKYICITLAEEFILKSLGSYFISKSFNTDSSSNFSLEIMRVTPYIDPNVTVTNTSNFLTFFLIFSKNNEKLPQIFSFLNNNLKNNNKSFPILTNQFYDFISSLQNFYLLSNRLSTIELGSFNSVPIYSSDPNETAAQKKERERREKETQQEIPRFTFYVLDALLPNEAKHIAVVLLIPKGCEADTNYTTKSGLMSLASQASCQRIIAVSCNRPHIFPESKELLQQELNPLVQFCLPKDVNLKKDTIPYMAVAAQYDWKTIDTKISKYSGELVIEELDDDDDIDSIYRRLIFLKNQDLIQTEVKLVKKVVKSKNNSKNKNKNKSKGKKNNNTKVEEETEEYQLDFTYVDDYISAIITSVSVASHVLPFNNSKSTSKSAPTCLQIGLGGGILPMSLRKLIPNLTLLSCDVDEVVGNCAKEYFGYIESGEMGTIYQDGLVLLDNLHKKLEVSEQLNQLSLNENENLSFSDKFLKSFSSNSLLDILIYDIDTTSTNGIVAPPKEFITMEKIEQVYDLLAPGGIFVINVLCRGPPSLYADLIQRLLMIFQVNSTGKNKGGLLKYKDPSSLNIILVAIKGGKENQTEFETLNLAITSSGTSNNSTTNNSTSSIPFSTRSPLQTSMIRDIKQWTYSDIFNLEEYVNHFKPVTKI